MGEERSIGSLISANDSRRFLLSARVWFSSPRLARQRAKIWTPKKGDETDTAALTLSTALRRNSRGGRKEGRKGGQLVENWGQQRDELSSSCVCKANVHSLPPLLWNTQPTTKIVHGARSNNGAAMVFPNETYRANVIYHSTASVTLFLHSIILPYPLFRITYIPKLIFKEGRKEGNIVLDSNGNNVRINQARVEGKESETTTY